MKTKAVYPFTAIVGQEEMKTALLLSIVMPSLGGVLIKGEKGIGFAPSIMSVETAYRELVSDTDSHQCCEG